MSATRRRSLSRGFTLIELLLVCLILGLLASIAIASFGTFTRDTREVALINTLRQFRNQLVTYRLQHGNVPPEGARMAEQLLQKTDLSGATGTSSEYRIGPYLISMPINAMNNRTDVKVLGENEPLVADGSTGWLYRVDRDGCTVAPNLTGNDSHGKAFVEY